MTLNTAVRRMIDAGFEVVAEAGPQGFTAEAVAAACGLDVDELNHCFASFDDLTAAVYSRCRDALLDELLAALHRVRTAEHGVQAVIVTYLRFTEQAPEVARFLHHAGHAAEQTHAHRSSKMDAIVNWFRPHMRSGAMAEIPEPFAEMLLIGPAAETARQWLAEAPGVDLDEAVQVLSARVWRSLCPQQTLTLVTREHQQSGLRLLLPEHWIPVHDEPLESFTLAVSGPPDDEDEDSPAGRDRAGVEERRLWQEVIDDDFGPGNEPGPQPARPPAIYAGRWVDQFGEQPGEQDLIQGADLLATTYGEYFRLLPADPGYGMDYSRRAMTVNGRHTATASYQLSGRHGESYLRAVLIRCGDGGVSFVLGLCSSRADRAVVDKILDSVEPLEI